MTREQVEAAILAFFQERGQSVQLSDGVLKTGALDSMQVIEFVLHLEEALGREIDPSLVTVENFDTLSGFADVILASQNA